MGFRQTLLEKIEIDTLAQRVIESFGPPGSGQRIDKDAMVRLLSLGDFHPITKRDLTLYILDGNEADGRILVLDNELAVYHTSAEDVALRKSPYINEMVRIRYIKKILNDTDVVESKREVSVHTVQNACIRKLDLTFTPSDIHALATDGMAALDAQHTAGVLETLILFAELLGFRSAPKPFTLNDYEILGKQTQGREGEILFGPILIYDRNENALKMIDTPISSLDKEKHSYLRQAAAGEAEPAAAGAEVFERLAESVLQGKD